MDYSGLAFWLGASILIYFVLLKISPDAGRAWFCLGGGLAGAYIIAVAGMLLVHAIYPDNAWARFGATIWLGPAFAAVGALIGFGAALRWTEPPASER